MRGEPPRHEPLPHLFDPLGQPFQPSAGQRRMGRLLLMLAALPGAIALLRAWHARRGRGD